MFGLNEKSHTLAKFLFVLGWLAVVGPGMLYGEDVGAKLYVADTVRAQLLLAARSATSFLAADHVNSAQAR